VINAKGKAMSDGMDKIFEINKMNAEQAHATYLERARSIISVLNEASKTAMAINGGAAVAMGALLQAIVDKPSLAPIRYALLCGIAIAAVGVLAGALTLLFRCFSLLYPENHPIYGNAWGRAALYVGLASVLTFLVGVGIPVIAGFVNLRGPGP
jgi:hypothetical protein